MKVVPKEGREPRASIDYKKLAELYNSLEVGGAVEMEPVYNITLFKDALGRRGVVLDTDFSAFNKDGITLVKRLSMAAMTQE